MVSLSVCAQEKETPLDSLLNVLKTARHDSTRVKTYANLTDVCEINDILTYAVPGMKLCEKVIAEKREPSRFYLWYYGGLVNNMGFYYSKHGDVNKSLEYYKKAAGILESINNKKEAAILLNNIAYIYQNQGDVRKALNYYFENLRVQEELKDDKGMSYTFANIGYTYSIQGDKEKAGEYYNKAIALYEKTGDKGGLAMVTINKGRLFKNKNQLKLEYFKKAMGLYAEAHDTHGVAYALMSIGDVYLRMGQTDTALAYSQRTLSLIEKYEYNDIISSAYINLARVLIEKNDLAKAKTYALRGLDVAQKRKIPLDIKTIAHVLKDIYRKQGNYKDAFAIYKLEMEMNDSLVNDETKRQFVKKQLEYDYEKKELQGKVREEQRLSVLKLENEKRNSRKNMIVYGLIFLAVILAVSIFYLYKFFQQKNVINANRNNELKQKLLRTQMNPHFIFNSVDNIQSLIHNKQDKEAINYLTKFSKLTRQILENSNENYISLGEELAMTENYMQIQQLLYNNKFSYTITVDESIDQEAVLLPPMLTQPFIENAIKHGLKHRENGGVVDVRFYMENKQLFFEVKDNGSGIVSKGPNHPHKSMSLNIVNERLNNNPAKKEILVNIKNLVENNEVKGAQTSFEIPYIYES